MSDALSPKSGSKAAFWTGWVLTAVVAFMFSMSAFMKLTKAPPLVEGFEKFGFDLNQAVPIGILEVACLLIFLIPQTSVLGAILLTGYLGGAVVTHLRIGDNFVPPIIIGIVVWLALALRDPRLWKLIPLRTSPAKPLS